MWILPSKTSNIAGLINYDFEKKMEGTSQSIASNIVFPDDKDYVIKTFESLKAQARSNATSHFVIGSVNLAHGELLTDEQLVGAIETYLSRINMKDYPVYISKHTDKKHLHAHFIASRVNFDGVLQNEKGIFFKKDAKAISNELNAKYGFEIIDRSLKASLDKGKKDYKEHAISVYSLHRLLKEEVGGRAFPGIPLEKQAASHIVDNNLNNSKIRDYLGKNDFYKLVNHYGKEKVYDQSYIDKLNQQLNAYYENSISKEGFINAVNRDPKLYCRQIQDNKSSRSNEKIIVYGIRHQGKMKYIDEKKLPLKFKNKYLHDIKAINSGEIRVLSYQQQRMVLKRNLSEIAKASVSLDDYFNRTEAAGINIIKSHSGDRLIGYRVSLLSASNPETFKASEIDRDLTITRLERSFESNNQEQLAKQVYQGRGEAMNYGAANLDPRATGGVKRDNKSNEEELEPRKKKRKPGSSLGK